MFGIRYTSFRIVIHMLTNIVHFSVKWITKTILMRTKRALQLLWKLWQQYRCYTCYFTTNSLLNGEVCYIYRCFSINHLKKALILVCYKTVEIHGLTDIQLYDNLLLVDVFCETWTKNRLIHFLSQVNLNYSVIIKVFSVLFPLIEHVTIKIAKLMKEKCRKNQRSILRSWKSFK